MTCHAGVFEAAQRARWLRPDTHRWIRPDAARFLVPGTDPLKVFPALQRKFSPDQPPAVRMAGSGRMVEVVSNGLNTGRTSDRSTCWKSATWVATPSKGMSAGATLLL